MEPGRHAQTTPLVSVVIITRNEEHGIVRCLESVAAELEGIPGEVVVVDSASTDRTPELVRAFGATLISLGSDLPLSASAGRYAGTICSRGEFIFFVDGDMTVASGWLRAGLARFENPGIAGVAGPFYWVYPGESQHMRNRDHRPTGEVETLSGTAIYRRSALLSAGTFNPWMKGEEERELGYRLRRAGYRLLRIDVPMAFHYAKELITAEADEKAMHHFGIGQIFRRFPLGSITRDLLRTYWVTFVQELSLVVSPLLLLLLAVTGFSVLAVWLFALAIVSLFGLILAKGVPKVMLFFRVRLLSFIRTVQGFRLGVPPATEYPWRVAE